MIANENSIEKIKCENGESIEILKKIEEKEIEKISEEIKKEGIDSVGVVFVHSYIFKEHEKIVKKILQ